MSKGTQEARATGGYERWVRRTDGPLLVLAVVLLGVLLLPTVVALNDEGWLAVNVTSGAIWLAFTVDYGARLYLSPRRWEFVRRHPLDLLVIVLPLLRPLRALRLLRLLRVGSVVGIVNRRGQRSLHARVSAYVAASVVVVLGASAVLMLEAESGSEDANITNLGDALWWAATTVTTVGYGDRYPTTGIGRLIAVALMLVGIALLGVVTATIAAWFVDRLREVEETAENTETTLQQVLAELREVRARFDAQDR